MAALLMPAQLPRYRPDCTQSQTKAQLLFSDPLCIDHQLLLTWFRIHLNQVDKARSRVSAKFPAHNSLFLPKDPNSRIFITDYSPVLDSGTQGAKSTPDSAFGISNLVANKTCLFFLEANRGTETLAGPKRDMSDIRQKIINYPWYFHGNINKRYDEVLNWIYIRWTFSE